MFFNLHHNAHVQWKNLDTNLVCIYVFTQAMTTLQQYVIPVIQRVVQVQSLRKTYLPMSGCLVWFGF